MAEILSFRRVLILADESADWNVAGLRQLERLVLAVDEFALENNEKAPVLVCIFWRPDLDALQRWMPKDERLTRVEFTNELDGSPYDLVLSTRLFVYRHALRHLIEAAMLGSTVMPSSGKMELWENLFRRVESLPQHYPGRWEYIANGDQIDAIEKRFLHGSGKSQDGIVSRYLNRPISRSVTRLLLRFPTTPNGWTFLIFPIPIIGTLVLGQGTAAAFFWGMILFQIFSVLDGCDGEIARAKFMESERGRQLDDQFDVLSNILLVIGLGIGLSRQSNPIWHAGWPYLIEGPAAAALIVLNEFYLTKNNVLTPSPSPETFGGTLYPRHRDLIERSGILFLGEKTAYWLMQLTKRDVAILFFVILAAIGWPALILHLQFGVTAASFALAWRARTRSSISK